MEKVPSCIINSSATLICMNDSCIQPNPFICSTANHECKQQHRTCLKLQWIIFKEKLDENRCTTNPTFQLLCAKIEKTITKGIQQLITELENFNKWKEQFGEVKKITDFYKSIQLNREAKWTGKDICQLKNEKAIKFDIDIKRIEDVLIQIEVNRSEFMEMIKGLYVVEKIQASNSIVKIKSYKLNDLCDKLQQIQQQPKHLELKFVEYFLFSV